MSGGPQCAAMIVVTPGVYQKRDDGQGWWFLGWKRQCSRRATNGEWCFAHARFKAPIHFDAEVHQFAPGMYVSEREARA